LKTKPVIPRELAGKDAENAVDCYLQEAGDQVALGFIGSLQKTCDFIGRYPQTGSPR